MWTPLELVCFAGVGITVACAVTVAVALWRTRHAMDRW